MKALLAALLLSWIFAPALLRADNLAPGPVVGIGTEIKTVQAHTIVASVLRGSPADNNGIRTGDRIVSIDGKNVDGMELHHVAQLLRGAANSRVRLTVDRHGRQLDFSLRRKILTLLPPSN